MLRQIAKRGASCGIPKLAKPMIQQPLTGLLKLNRVAPFIKTKPLAADFNGESAVYAESMYEQWKKDPSSVDSKWQSYFQGFEFGTGATMATLPDGSAAAASSGDVTQAQKDGFKILALIRAYMTHGHYKADVDPLKLGEIYADDVTSKFKKPGHEMLQLLDPAYYGFTEADMDRKFFVSLPQWGGILGTEKREWTLREIVQAMDSAYCGKIGVEYMHIPNREQCNYIREKIELRHQSPMTKEQKIQHLDRLYWTDGFAQFISQKFNTMKRFGLEGVESFIPGMKVCMDSCMEHGASKVVVGMPHRGRLNMLANVVRKPLRTIFAEFQGVMPNQDGSAQADASGDVKYHLGTSFTRKYEDGKELTVEVLANPSHLECVNPVVMGRVRAENHLRSTLSTTGDLDTVVPVLIHGDAAFAGQGVVYESMQMQDLKNYSVGGTIHIIVNNQIGFTTVPSKGRSDMYASDLAKAISAPIFHINADSMEDVYYGFKIASEYRQKFNHDVVIDLIGYRKMGHNELDQPSFTQPLMYKQVAKMTPVARIYEQQMIADGTVTQEQANVMKAKINDQLEQAYAESKDHEFQSEEWETKEWESIKQLDENAAKHSGLPLDHVRELGLAISTLPEEKFHKNVKKIFEARVKSFETGKSIDWGTAEALACASLIQEGYNVRISGQDVERGTFSHRHAHVFYQDRDGYYNPINAAVVGQDSAASEGLVGTGRKFIASNSHLSEFAVLGYELGYAQTHPNSLTMWEAQFGDFANGAQVIIDQFICSGESKWNVKNGLVMLLPHGYDGAGPEHSSSRAERYLQLCNQDEFVPEDGVSYDNKDIMKKVNMRVVMPSTAANYFHLLRTHMRLPFRKPVVVVAPKKLLKFKGAMSDIEDFAGESRWQYLLPDNSGVQPAQVKKVILCSGQVYYDLEAERNKSGRKDVAILRVESLCPFPFKEIIAELKRYNNAMDITWAQEEPKNAGAWLYAQPRMNNIMDFVGRKGTKLTYAGRPIMAATAVGYTKTHNDQLAQLIADAFA